MNKERDRKREKWITKNVEEKNISTNNKIQQVNKLNGNFSRLENLDLTEKNQTKKRGIGTFEIQISWRIRINNRRNCVWKRFGFYAF